ncbi:E3 ubiquitin-protein ligase TRIM35 [Nothobranchius furzeri]|uniref:Tripartite motif-containing protein 35-like n=1 Tax=Nothobranchius furzeri TaxID=105023 RepID=A0A8C6KX71_NOTFU|nr:E3 ubiquitin-protein ligase TRIM35 [Nothobranchius furzeri]KAF7207534.1 tripartite motif-containing protein 35-like [Nothobranchius furzeri]
MLWIPEEDVCCPICRDVFRDPAELICKHSYCRSCLDNWWDGKIILECPVCKKTSPTRDPPSNNDLRHKCVLYLQSRGLPAQEEPEVLCSLHNEELKLFCVDHREAVCLTCQCSDIHIGHRFKPVKEVAREQKRELKRLLGPLQDKLKLLNEAKEGFDEEAKHITIQAQFTAVRMKEQFRRLRKFLQKEEELQLSALREEETRKSQLLQTKIEALSKEIAALSGILQDTEEMIRGKDSAFLVDFKSTVRKIQQRPPLENSEPISGALIDVANHLGNLGFNIWNKMKHVVSYTPVVLDPNTANAELLVSDDLTSVKQGEKQNVPNNPERFDYYRIVLGSEGFDSGTRSWDVAIGESASWFVGVASEDVKRKGKHPSSLWRIGCLEGKYYARSLSDPSTTLSPIGKLQRIRVYLDCSRGKLLFFDLDTNTHLHTFTHTFTGKIFPYFNTVNTSPMKILPETLLVKQLPE